MGSRHAFTDHAPVDLRLDALLVGESAVMKSLKAAIASIAEAVAPVLVTGPTGAGKEVVAEGLHLMSERPGALVPVNCGAIPGELLESQLFGHERGAFTGAQSRHIGLIEQAQNGTLFLDEFGEMPADLQVKLLRALETKHIQRVGGAEMIPVDFRLVSATNRDLHEEVQAGRFRSDLLYRIEVFQLSVPALADHCEDIPAILRSMSRHRFAPLQLTPAALEQLMAQPWPGNVRELRNFHDRAQVLFRNRTIDADDLPRALSPRLAGAASPMAERKSAYSAPPTGGEASVDLHDMLAREESVDLRALLAQLEGRFVSTALELSGGCVARAAARLGLKRTTLIGKMKKLGLEADGS
ncbi:MAG: sigma-54 dependent transcriptional regulator [Pseudomonadota bacterium]